jgi:uncharacterized membrane protein
MIVLTLGLVIFLGAHSVRIFAADWREAQIAARGPVAWKILFALASLLGLALIAVGLGGPITALSFVLVAAAYIPGTRIKARLGHPMVAGIKAWAFAHLIANGNLADVLLFGSFLAWGVLDFRAARRRDRAAATVYPDGSASRDGVAVAVGLASWAVFAFWLHGWLFGVRPFG